MESAASSLQAGRGLKQTNEQTDGTVAKRTSTLYDADAIETLEGLDAVRKRPGMYIGGTGGEGLMHLLWELIDNAVDEAAAGFADEINVVFHPDRSLEVADNGRGIPVGMHTKRKVSALEVVFTDLHAGGKFGGGAYKASGGLHGVGASVVNALSTQVSVRVDRDGHRHELRFKDRTAGQFSGKTFKAGHTLKKTKQSSSRKRTGTNVRFWPDFDIFDPDAELSYDGTCDRLTQACFLVPGMKVTVTDKRTKPVAAPFKFVSVGGLEDMIEHLGGSEPLCGVIKRSGTGTFVEKVPVNKKMTEVERECVVDIAMRWENGYDTKVVSFVNTIPTSQGGTHLSGFDRALTRVVNNVALKDHRKLKKLADKGRHKATKDDVQEGLVLALKVTLPEPQFRGQTKQQLGTPSVEGIVSRIVYDHLKSWFGGGVAPRSHVKAVTDKLVAAVSNREASKTLLENKRKASKLDDASMPHKLADCREHGPGTELILVEGDSAAGPAKRGRDSETMAILPLRGKVVNAYKATVKQVLDNAEAKALFTAIGAGVGHNFKIEDTRYERIVILCDADVDGSHIRCLLLTVIYKYMNPMLAAGRVFVAQPPLFTAKVGTDIYRAYTDEEKQAVTKRLTTGRRKRNPDNIKWQRFKGLGEMNVEELRHCALDPQTRTLKRVTMQEGKQAAEALEMFEVLMGNDVSDRRDYIINNSALVDGEALDV